MNQGLKLIVASVALGAALLTACGSKGGGGGNASPGPAACVPDASGNCVVGVGAAGYVGDGSWQGRMMINSLPLFQQFAYENGLCYGQDCSYISGYINLQLTLRNGGCLPGPGNFAITTYQQGYSGRTLSQRGDAYMNAGSNGFLINFTSGQRQQTQQWPQQPQQPGQQALGTMQINTQWVDATKSTLNVQITYRGQQIAAGQVYGYSQAQGVGAQNAQMCAGGGWSQPYGGNPYPGQNAGWNQPQNPYYIWSGQYYYPYGRRN